VENGRSTPASPESDLPVNFRGIICIKYVLLVMEIVWDKNKAAINMKRHGVSFVSAIAVLSDDSAITLEDIDHEEQRFITIGMDMECSILVLVYYYPDETTIRIISARKAEPHERKEYES
jgi:uncharacterized DUF497 family protein